MAHTPQPNDEQAREGRLQAVLNSIGEVLFEFDRRGTYLNIWTSDESLLARPRSEMLGRSVSDVLGTERARPFVEAIQRVIATGEPETIEYEMEVLGGRQWFLGRVAPIRAPDGIVTTASFATREITDRIKAEAEVRRALAAEQDAVERLRALDELKNAFLTAVSHELRTPLTAILGSALTLERTDLELSGVDRTALTQAVASNARKLSQLLSDLLDLDRLTRGMLQPVRRPTDVAAMVRKLVEGADELKGHALEMDISPVVVEVDAAKVERIVENLLVNAARHTPIGTSVRVAVASRGGQGVLITVEDDGPGVPDDLKEAIFQPFRRGPDEQDSPGVGIGLSLVAKFADLHAGRAWVEDRPGGGASFHVFLPGSDSGTEAVANGDRELGTVRGHGVDPHGEEPFDDPRVVHGPRSDPDPVRVGGMDEGGTGLEQDRELREHVVVSVGPHIEQARPRVDGRRRQESGRDVGTELPRPFDREPVERGDDHVPAEPGFVQSLQHQLDDLLAW